MKARRVFLSLALIVALYGLVQAQYREDKYRVKTGENLMRVMVSNRTQTPLANLTLKFAENQPHWFARQKEEQFDLDAKSAELIELPFQVNPAIGGTLTEPVTLQLLAQKKVLGTIAVKLSLEGVLGKTSGSSSTANSLLGENAVSKAVESEIVPTEFALRQNYPNPFSAGGGSAFGGNPRTTFEFAVPRQVRPPELFRQADGGQASSLTASGQAEFVSIKVFDVLGREVATLVNEMRAPGVYRVSWDGRNDNGQVVPSGVYLYRMVSGNASTGSARGFVQTKKMLLLR